MKQFLSYMIVALAALWMAGCSDDSLSPADQPERGIVIRLSAGQLETRTDLTSQANLQHVREVYALLYDDTGDLVGSPELLMDVDKTSQAWDPTEGGSYNDINGEEFVLPQTKTAGLEAGDYTVLCVGLDDRSGETYGLTLDKMKTWTTLKHARATLADGKGVDDIAHAELFAGWSGFEFKPDSINVVEVMLKRRMAGVLCYVTDIPTTINKDGENKSVKKLRLALYTGEKPNNQISLCRKEVEKATDGTIKIPDDFGENNPNPNAAQLTPNSKGYLILKEIDLEHLYNSDESQTGEIFVIPEIETDALKVEANSLLLGAYVIPTAATEGEVTLKVELLGEGDKVLATFNAKRNGTSENESYNIYPNYIYHIGDKPESDSTEGDQPASLLGKKLTVKPQPWDGNLWVDVEFPSVPLMATMKLIDQNGQEYSREHIFDCPGVDDQYYSAENKNGGTYYSYHQDHQRIKLQIIPPILKRKWKVTIGDPSTGERSKMLYIKDENENYVQTYPEDITQFPEDMKDGAMLDLLMTSYAVDDDTKKSRKVTIQLVTYDDNDKPAYSSSWEVEQYNAIIVDIGSGRKRGFCHYDYGAEFGEAKKLQWGYTGGTGSTVVGDNTWKNGDVNFTTARENAGTNPEGNRYKAFFGGCAMYLCGRPFISVTNGKKDTPSKNWYLPARKELQAFFDKRLVGENRFYWTSTAYGFNNAYYNYITSKGLFDDSEFDIPSYTTDRSNSYYIRQACIISD